MGTLGTRGGGVGGWEIGARSGEYDDCEYVGWGEFTG
jgi:hypothetical protein